LYRRLLPTNNPDVAFTERGLAEIEARRGVQNAASRR
jgi:hypothetical protein